MSNDGAGPNPLTSWWSHPQDLYHERLVDKAQFNLRVAVSLLRYAQWDDDAIRAAVEQCLGRRA